MSELRKHEWEIAFTLAPGYDENDAIELYELIEQHPSVDGAVLVETVARYDPEPEESRGP